jgi:hypothetical protein
MKRINNKIIIIFIIQATGHKPSTTLKLLRAFQKIWDLDETINALTGRVRRRKEKNR